MFLDLQIDGVLQLLKLVLKMVANLANESPVGARGTSSTRPLTFQQPATSYRRYTIWRVDRLDSDVQRGKKTTRLPDNCTPGRRR